MPVDQGGVHVGPHAVHRLRANKEMIALRKNVSIVFQQYNLFPQKTALAMRPSLLLFDEVPAALFRSPPKERAGAFLERVL